MRKHSDIFLVWLLVAGTVLAWLFKTTYEDLAKAWVLKQLASLGVSDQAAVLVSGLVEIVPSITAATAIVIGLYLLIGREFRSQRVACTEIGMMKTFSGDVRVRAKLENAAHADIVGLKAYLEAIECPDPLQYLAKIDLPIPLYSQERLRERNVSDDPMPVRPLNLSRNQPKWIELFRMRGPRHEFYLADSAAQLMTAERAEFKFGIYGPIPNLTFFVVWEENDKQQWRVTLLDKRKRQLSQSDWEPGSHD